MNYKPKFRYIKSIILVIIGFMTLLLFIHLSYRLYQRHYIYNTNLKQLTDYIISYKKDHSYINIIYNKKEGVIEIPYCILLINSSHQKKSQEKALNCNLTPYIYIQKLQKEPNNSINIYNLYAKLPQKLELQIPIPITFKVITNIQTLNKPNSLIPVKISIYYSSKRIIVSELPLPDQKIRNIDEALDYLRSTLYFYEHDINNFYKKLKGPIVFECQDIGCQQLKSSGKCKLQHEFLGFPSVSTKKQNSSYTINTKERLIPIKRFYKDYCSWYKKLGLAPLLIDNTISENDINGTLLQIPYPNIVNCTIKTVPQNLYIDLSNNTIIQLARLLYEDQRLSPFAIPHTYLDIVSLQSPSDIKQGQSLNINLTISVINEAWYYYIISNFIQ